MRISKKEFDKLVALLKTLKGDARADLLATLKSAKVYDLDKDGKEFDIEIELVEKTIVDAGAAQSATTEGESAAGASAEGEEGAAEDAGEEGQTATGAADLQKQIDAGVAIALKRLNTQHVKANRRVVHIGTPKSVYAVPDRAKRARVKNFKAYEGQEFTPGERAYRFGQVVRAAAGRRDAKNWCTENGIVIRQVDDSRDDDMILKDQVEFDNARGGILVPPEFDTDLIVLRETFGLFRQFARNSTMSSETKTRMRRVGGLTATFVAEQQKGQVSTATWDQVQLVAKKLMAIAIVSNELDADAAINLGDYLAAEIAYAFARAEDDAGFNGDGTSTYGRIVGLRQRLLDIWGTGGGAGLVLGANGGWGAITLAKIQAVVGALPVYAQRPETAFYASNAFWGTVMQPLAMAAGGTTMSEIIEGVRTPMFLGYPVRITQSLPTSTAVSQIPLLFGALDLSSDFGDRTGTTIKISEEGTVDGVSLFQTDQMAIRGTERFDINNHDVGTNGAGGTPVAAGPVVGLLTGPS